MRRQPRNEREARALLAQRTARLDAIDHEYAARRAEAVAEVAEVVPLVKAFSALRRGKADASLSSEVNPREGLTKAILKVLQAAKGRPLAAPEIRDALVEGGFSVSRYKTFVGVIGTTLRRLQGQGAVRQAKTLDDKSVGWYPAGFFPQRPTMSSRK